MISTTGSETSMCKLTMIVISGGPASIRRLPGIWRATWQQSRTKSVWSGCMSATCTELILFWQLFIQHHNTNVLFFRPLIAHAECSTCMLCVQHCTCRVYLLLIYMVTYRSAEFTHHVFKGLFTCLPQGVDPPPDVGGACSELPIHQPIAARKRRVR